MSAAARSEDVEVVDLQREEEVHERRLDIMTAAQVREQSFFMVMDTVFKLFPHSVWRVLPTCRSFRTGENETSARRCAFRRICNLLVSEMGRMDPELLASEHLFKMARALVPRCPAPPKELNFASLLPNATPLQMLQHAANLSTEAARFRPVAGRKLVGDAQLAWCSRELVHLAREVVQWYNKQGRTRFVVVRDGAAGDPADSEVLTVTAPTSYVTRSDRPTTLSSSSDAPPDDEDVIDISLGDGCHDHADAGVLLHLAPLPEVLQLRRNDQTGLLTPAAFGLLRVAWGEKLPPQGLSSSGVDGRVLQTLAKLVMWGDKSCRTTDPLNSISGVEILNSEGKSRCCRALHCFAAAVKAHCLVAPEGESEFKLLLRSTQDEVQERLRKRKENARRQHRRQFPRRNFPRQRREMSAAEVAERELRMAEVQAQDRQLEEELRAIDASWMEEQAEVEALKLREISSWLPKLKVLCAHSQQAQALAFEAMAYFSTIELDGTMAGLIMLVLGFFRRDQTLLHKRLNLLSRHYHDCQDEDAQTLVRLSQSCCLYQDQGHRMPDSLHFFRIAQCELYRDTELFGGAYICACVEALKQTLGGERQWHLKECVANLHATLQERGEESRLLDQPQYLHKIKQITDRC